MFVFFDAESLTPGNLTLTGVLTALVSKELMQMFKRGKSGNEIKESLDKQTEVLHEVKEGINKLITIAEYDKRRKY